MEGRVIHQVAMPDQGGGSLDEFRGVSNRVQAGEEALRLGVCIAQLLGGGRLEAREQLRHGLILARDSGNRHGAGDDAHLVGGVARVLRLPQRVFAKPRLEIAVDGRHPRHGFYMLVVQRDPPGGVPWGHACRRRLRVGFQQKL